MNLEFLKQLKEQGDFRLIVNHDIDIVEKMERNHQGPPTIRI